MTRDQYRAKFLVINGRLRKDWKITCPNCAKTVVKRNNQINQSKRVKQHFCSRHCAVQYQHRKGLHAETVPKLWANNLGHRYNEKAWTRILQKAKELEAEGYRVIPITNVIPDIIAIKGNEVVAVEVEYGYAPNFAKYQDGFEKHFDAVIWELHRKARIETRIFGNKRGT